LHDAADLIVAADHGVQLAALGRRGEILTVALERLIRAFRVRRRDALISTHFAQGRQHGVAVDAGLAQESRRGATVFEHREQQMFDRDVFVGQLRRFVVRANERSRSPGTELRLRVVRAAQTRQVRDGGRSFFGKIADVDAGFAEKRGNDAVGLFEK